MQISSRHTDNLEAAMELLIAVQRLADADGIRTALELAVLRMAAEHVGRLDQTAMYLELVAALGRTHTCPRRIGREWPEVQALVASFAALSETSAEQLVACLQQRTATPSPSVA